MGKNQPNAARSETERDNCNHPPADRRLIANRPGQTYCERCNDIVGKVKVSA